MGHGLTLTQPQEAIELRHHLQAFSMVQKQLCLSPTGFATLGTTEYRSLPLDTSVAASLRWLKVSLAFRFERQLCDALAHTCKALEHVYISGPGTDA